MNRSLTVNISARSVLVAISILIGLWLATQIPTILVTLLVALIIAAAMLPGVKQFQERFGWPRVAAVVGMFGLIFGVLLLLGLIMVPTIVDQAHTLAQNLPGYTAKIQQTYSWLQGFDQRFHFLPSLEQAAKTASAFAAGWLTSTLAWAGKVVGGVANVAMVLITTFFLLLEGPELKRGALSLIPPAHRPRYAALFEPLALKLGGYVQGVLMSIGFLTGYLAIALSIAGVPLALVLALLAGMMEIIPLVGSLLGAIPAVLVALTVSWQLGLVVLAIFLVGNAIQGNVVAPFVFSKSIEVSPLMVLFALLIGAQLMGIAGALIAVPVMAALIVLVQNLYIAPMEQAYQEQHAIASEADAVSFPAPDNGAPPAAEA